MFWHVFKGVKPTSAASTAGNLLSGVFGGALAASPVPIARAPIGSPSTNANSATTTTTTSQVKSRPLFGFQLIQTTETEDEESRFVVGSRDSRGYFADSCECMQLYNTIKTSFEAFKSSSSEPSKTDRTMDLLTTTLVALSRLTEVLRFAEVVGCVEEILVYLGAAFVWAPVPVLDASLSLLRALFGSNLSSIWNRGIAEKFYHVLNRDADEVADVNETDAQIRRLCEAHLQNVAQNGASTAVDRTFLDWLLAARHPVQPAMLRASSLPPNIQQLNLAYYIRLFEPLVLQCLHEYHLHTDPAVHAKFLHILTALIELGVNYAQLDSNFVFLNAVMAQCESMQHSNATASYIHQTSSSRVSHLLSNMFQFFVTLTYEKRSGANTSDSEAKTVLSLSEVVHLAEVLAAGGVDVDSLVVPALAPLIIDIYVRRGARYQPLLRADLLNSPAEPLGDVNAQLRKDLHDWNVHRESLLRFLLPKFIGHPRTFDFLCVVLENATLTDATLKVSFEDGDSSLAYKTAIETCRYFLSALSDYSLALNTCGDVEACLRLIVRLASPPWPSSKLLDFVRQLVSIILHQTAHAASLKQSLQQLQQWLGSKLVCLRFLLLLALKQPSALSSALRDLAACGELAPPAVLFGHLLDHLANTVDALLNHLPEFMDEFISNASPPNSPPVERLSPATVGQMLLAFELEILTFSRLHASSWTGIAKEKVEHLDEVLATYGRVEPLSTLLWHQIRADILHAPTANSHLSFTPYHRNSVLIRRVLFLLQFRRKSQIEQTTFFDVSLPVDLLGLLDSSEVYNMIHRVGDVTQRSALLNSLLSTLLTGISGSETLSEAVALFKHLKIILQKLPDFVTQEDGRKDVLLPLIHSLEKWFSPNQPSLLLKSPALRWEMELILTEFLRKVEEFKVEEISGGLKNLLASLLRSNTFFTRELPEVLTNWACQLARAPDEADLFSQGGSEFVTNLIETNLKNCLSVSAKDGGRLAARLLQLKRPWTECDLPDEMPPRLLQNIIRRGFVETMKRFNNDDAGTLEADRMWQLGKVILFKQLSSSFSHADARHYPAELLRQCQLAGLTAATIDFLLLSARLPLPSPLTVEEVDIVSGFLCHLMQSFVSLVGETKSAQPTFLSLPLLTLQLSVVLVKSTNSTSLDSKKLPLATCIEFAEALDVSASLSRPVTLMKHPPPLDEAKGPLSQGDAISRLRCLLVPRQPGIFRVAASASTLTRFTEVLNSFAANAGVTGGGVVATEKSRVALASALDLCRLCPLGLRYAQALGLNNSDLAGQFAAFLITLARRPEVMPRIRRPSAFTDTDAADGEGEDPHTHQWSPERVAEMDRDALAEASTWMLSLGWLDRSMFESAWTALLAACTPLQTSPSLPLSSADSDENPFVNSKEELVEVNYCRVLALNALTRLLLNAAHLPRPGDPLTSRPLHHPRLSMPPQFMHTRLGGRIAQVLSRLDQEKSTWLYDIPSTSAVIGCDAGNSEGYMPWLSTNLDLEHPWDLDSPANQVPIECLVKWMSHSPAEPASFEADTIFSCLQSLRLVLHAWLRPFEERFLNQARGLREAGNAASPLASMTSSSQRKKFAQFFKRGVRNSSLSQSADSSSHSPIAFGDSILLTGVLSGDERTDEEPVEESESIDDSFKSTIETTATTTTRIEQMTPSLAVLTAVVKSAVLCSDLFTTREQFLWLIGCLQAVYQSLPRIEDGFEAPIYVWLIAGLARCTAVLEATMLPAMEVGGTPPPMPAGDGTEGAKTEATAAVAPQQHHSAPILLTANLQAAVTAVIAAIDSPCVAFQDAGLRAAMDLLQAALLLRATHHPALQQPALLANQPTGSALLNTMLIQVCLYLNNRLYNLFESDTTLQKRWQTEKKDTSAPLRFGAGNSSSSSSISRITAELARGSSTSSPSSSSSSSSPFNRGLNSALKRAAEQAYRPRPPSEWAAERTSAHQCTILAAAFYVVEQFLPLVNNNSTTIGRMVIKLGDQLLALVDAMLQNTSRVFQPPARLHQVFMDRFMSNQMTMLCADSVVFAWTRGMQRLLLSGMLEKEECEMLAEVAANLVFRSNSVRLRLPALSLLLTVLYVPNAGFHFSAIAERGSDAASKSSSEPSTDRCWNDSTEYLGILDNCLLARNDFFISPYITSLEARCIALALTSLRQDLCKSVLCATPALHSPQAVGDRIRALLFDLVRADHGYTRLAAAVLHAFVAACRTANGLDVIRRQVLLTLPSLLHAETPSRHHRGYHYWLTAVCTLLCNGARDLHCETLQSILAISLANPPFDWARVDRDTEERSCLDLLLAAFFLLAPPSSAAPAEEVRFRDSVLEIIQDGIRKMPPSTRWKSVYEALATTTSTGGD